jgi:DNA oxidative demethylase
MAGQALTASYGWRYDFDDASFAPSEAIPDWLLPPRKSAARFACLRPDGLVQALLIRYDPGSGIGWHRDRPVFAHVFGFSLGAPATMRFRRRRSGGFDRASVLLAPRSIYHRTGEARHEWEHGIAAMEATRWPITFRSLSRRAARKGYAHNRHLAGHRFASEGYRPPAGKRTPRPGRRLPADLRGLAARFGVQICRTLG